MNFPICESGGLRDTIAYLKRRRSARAIARACGVPLEKRELRLVAGDEHPKDVLAYWKPEKSAPSWRACGRSPTTPQPLNIGGPETRGAWRGLCLIRQWIGVRRKRRRAS